MPQPPQLFASVLMSTHFPPQSARWSGHVHVPLTHAFDCFAMQDRPQPPQLLESELVSTQVPLQTVPAQGKPSQNPLVHADEPQELPQPPQFSGSSLVLTHVSPQFVRPSSQEHMPLMH